MRFISARDFRANTGKIWKELDNENELVVTLSGKPFAILSKTSDQTLEENLKAIRRAKAMVSVSAMQLKSMQLGNDKMSLDEINKIIKSTRKK